MHHVEDLSHSKRLQMHDGLYDNEASGLSSPESDVDDDN